MSSDPKGRTYTKRVQLKGADNIWSYGRGPNRTEKIKRKQTHNLYSSPNIITVIKLRIMRGVGHVARIRDIRNV